MQDFFFWNCLTVASRRLASFLLSMDKSLKDDAEQSPIMLRMRL